MNLLPIVPFIVFGLLAMSFAFALYSREDQANTTPHPDTTTELNTTLNE